MNDLNKLSGGEIKREDDDDESLDLEPGEIVRDTEGQRVRDSLLKREVEEENLPQVLPQSDGDTVMDIEPGEIVRDTLGEIVGDSSLKTEVEDQVHIQETNQDLPETSPQDREELESAVGFLMEQDDSPKDVKEEAGEDNPATNAADDETDYSLGAEEFKCVFACGLSFSREEDLYIHITDKHNNF